MSGSTGNVLSAVGKIYCIYCVLVCVCVCVCVVCFSKEDGTLGHCIYGDINLLTVVSGGLDYRL